MNKKFHPILFSTPMVQAILEGRKTMTRRIKGLECVNDEPDFYHWLNEYEQMDIPHKAVPFDDKFYYAFTGKHNNTTLVVTDCPYGKVGDVLWVRETWNTSEDVRPEIKDKFIYRADRSEIDGGVKWAAKWKPSIFMPKSACRLFLEITDVRVERLQDISEEDAISEGIYTFEGLRSRMFKKYPGRSATQYTKESFKTLWQSINGPDSWDSNPFVWVVSFKKIDRPENF